jgi:hypothetical protein
MNLPYNFLEHFLNANRGKNMSKIAEMEIFKIDTLSVVSNLSDLKLQSAMGHDSDRRLTNPRCSYAYIQCDQTS